LAKDILGVIRGDVIRERHGLRKENPGILFKDFSKRFLKEHSRQKKSYRRDEVATRLYLIPFFGKMALSRIEVDDVKRYIVNRKKQRTYRGGLTNSATINRELALLKTMTNKGIEWEFLEASPIIWKRIPRLDEDSRTRFLRPEETTALIQAVNGNSPHLRAFLSLALNTGLRKSEILGLSWRDIYLEGESPCIVIEKQGRKNKKQLTVPINQNVLEVLNEMKKTANGSPYVFYNPDTETHLKDVRTSFKTACEKAGIRNLRIHDLRRTFATTLNNKGAQTLTISELLGHSNLNVTRNYISGMNGVMKKAVDTLGDEFNFGDNGRKENVSQVYIQ